MIAKGRARRTKITATIKRLLPMTEVIIVRRKLPMVRIRQMILRTKKEQPILATKTLTPDPNTAAGLGVRKAIVAVALVTAVRLVATLSLTAS